MAQTNGTAKAADTYGLTRDAKESSRLNMQHVVWRQNMGFLLHPRVADDLPDDARIGDVGTGTGIWLIELAKEYGQTKHSYEGFDISSSQFPAEPTKDVSFSILNVLDPVPQHLVGTFDVIHLRLLILGLPKYTWELACRNVLQLLKPGGWLQWEEANFVSMSVLQKEPAASRESLEKMIKTMVQDGLNRGQGWDEVSKLPSIAVNSGFADVHTDVFSSDRVSDTRDDFSKVCVGALESITQMFRKMDGGSGYWASDDAAKLHKAAAREAQGGKVYIRADLQVVYAQKAR